MTRRGLRLRGLGLVLLLLAVNLRPPTATATLAEPAREPVAVSAPFDTGWATQVVTGLHHTCALTTSGGVKCWGANNHGELGDGTQASWVAPVAVVGLVEIGRAPCREGG